MRIGIVNDLNLARVAMQRVLVPSPHEVAWLASDGGEAIARAREDLPDLILMDLFMPSIDGVEATRQIMSESHVRDPARDIDGERASGKGL